MEKYDYGNNSRDNECDAYKASEDKLTEKDLTFPGLLTNTQCYAELKAHKEYSRPYQKKAIVLFVCFPIFWAGFIFSVVTVNVLGIIVCIVMAILSIIVAILLLKKGGKGSKYSVATLQHTIALNNRYAGFLKNGFSPKEAYVYTLEWSDRQASIEALDNVASMVGVVAMSNLIRPNK